jgi:hypothetical protein
MTLITDSFREHIQEFVEEAISKGLDPDDLLEAIKEVWGYALMNIQKTHEAQLAKWK